MFSGCLQDFSRMFSGCSDGSCGPGGIWWSFQMKVWTLMTQRNSMITSYLMIPAILWSQLFYDPSYYMIPAILWSQLFYDPQLFDDPKLYNYPQLLNDQLEVWTLIIQKPTVIPSSPMVYLTMSLEAMRAWKLRFLQYKLVQFHAWSFNQRFSQLSLKHFITSKSDNEILKQSSSLEQSQLF